MIIENYKKLFNNDDIFQEVCKKISMKKGDIVRSNQILKSFIVDKFIPCMKENDDHFKEMFEKVKFVGSYYKNLKVSKPNEFDLNLVIKLPGDRDAIKVDTDHEYDGFAVLKVDKSRLSENDQFWRTILDPDDYLDQDKFRNWMQGVFDKAIKKLNFVFKSRRKVYKVTFRRHNPAFTLHIEQKGAAQPDPIDFDLVPCLEFNANFLKGYRSRQIDECNAIARPLWTNKPSVSNLLWRLSFYREEKKLLKGIIKSVIRVFKKLRDEQMPFIKSHSIEVLFLHELADENYHNIYMRVSRTCLLMSALVTLHKKLEAKQFFSYWNAKHDLLSFKNPKEIENVANHLKSIINHVEKDPKNLRKYFNLK